METTINNKKKNSTRLVDGFISIYGSVKLFLILNWHKLKEKLKKKFNQNEEFSSCGNDTPPLNVTI